MSEPKIAVTAEDLKAILSSVIAETRKPIVTEEEVKARAAAIEQRRQGAIQQLELMQAEQFKQANCSHKRRNGSSRMVNVNLGEYFLCQLCGKIARPETDLAIYNEHMQIQSPADF